MKYSHALDLAGIPPVAAELKSLIALALLVASGLALGHQGATGVVKERMDMMAEIGDDMKGIKAMIQGKQPYDAKVLATHAESIHQSAPSIKQIFPEGSLAHPSEALPRIWQDWDRFTTLVDQLTVESERLRDLAESQDRRVLVRQFARVGKTCRGCHTDFRKKQDRKQ